MAITKYLHKRGANVTVAAYGEVLFADGADIGRFKNRLSNRVTAFTRAAAPSNKRPRWAHYGKPLKDTFNSRTETTVTRGGAYFRVAVGSSAPHALYVDQGTGEYVGHSAWVAKVLPPYSQGGASLYEHTWIPNGMKHKVAPVMIRGQEGQFFFNEGLKRGMESVLHRTYQVPGEGISGVTGKIRWIESVIGHDGSTTASGAFQLQLDEWRLWRDTAWDNGFRLGRGAGSSPRQSGDNIRGIIRERQAAQRASDRTGMTPAEKVAALETARVGRANEASARAADVADRKLQSDLRKAQIEENQNRLARADAARRSFNRARDEARAYADVLRPAYPNVRVLKTKSGDRFRVSWTDSTGQKHVQDFAT